MSHHMRTGPAGNGTGQSQSGQDDPTKGTSPRLFDPGTTRTPQWTDDLHSLSDRRREGERRALEAAAASWRRDAEWALRQLAEKGEPFTAEDLRELVGDPMGPSGNSMGALFSSASKAGIIEHAGYGTASRDEAHGRVLRTWIGARGRS